MLVWSNAKRLMNCAKVVAKRSTIDTWCEWAMAVGMSSVYRVAFAVYRWIIPVTREAQNYIANPIMIGKRLIPIVRNFPSPQILTDFPMNFLFNLHTECFRWNVCDVRIECCQTIWLCGHKITYSIWRVSCVACVVSRCRKANNSFCGMDSSSVGTISRRICTCHSITVRTMSISSMRFVRETVDVGRSDRARY